ncbi:MAG: response regulator [Vulcanimicrobiota bacterium]
MRILLVAPGAAESQALAEELRRLLALEVVIVSSADDALYQLRDARDFALVVTELDLRGQSGLELAATVRSRQRTRHIPILVCGEDTTTDTIVALARVGIRHYLAKPFSAEALRAKLRACFETGAVRLPRKQRLMLLLELDDEGVEELTTFLADSIGQLVEQFECSPGMLSSVGQLLLPEVWSKVEQAQLAKHQGVSIVRRLEAYRAERRNRALG